MDDGIFDIKPASKLDNPRRIEVLKPYELLKDAAGVAKDMTCVDFGSGTGTFALPMADLVGDKGKVYAVDNSIEMLTRIRAKNPPLNLTLVNSDVEQTKLGNKIADICLLTFILHEVKKPEDLITEAFRLLKPEGRIVIVEWKAELDSPGPPRRVRISHKQIKQLFEQVGLAAKSYIEWSDNHYIAIGIK